MAKSVTSGVLGTYRTRPIAEAVAAADARRPGYRSHPIDLDAPEQTDPMVDLSHHGIAGLNHYHRPDNPPYHQSILGAVPELLFRASLTKRLEAVNTVLSDYGLELWVFDAWRPIAVQNHFHDHWMPAYLQAQDPTLTGEALQTEVEKYWARGAPGGVIDPRSPPPHATGSAVDLTLRTVTGAELYMGSIFDDVTEVSNTAYFETADALSFSDVEARDNRRMLFWLMQEAGFANNPTEWWHFSRGDQMWARITNAPAAHYSIAPV